MVDLRARALIENLHPQLFVCGHSHILKVQNDHHYNMLTVNPGACGIQGWHIVRTACIPSPWKEGIVSTVAR